MQREIYEQIEYFEVWLKAKRYSNSTIKTFSQAIKQFLNYFHDKRPNDITNQDIVRFPILSIKLP